MFKVEFILLLDKLSNEESESEFDDPDDSDYAPDLSNEGIPL